mmetsp:Transcript_32061/g.96521  ORF Transcript_32061/g.96521 Transcript_32061/m.96521 type:complete len:159 (-) Transcript_32061:1611-2087(-)
MIPELPFLYRTKLPTASCHADGLRVAAKVMLLASSCTVCSSLALAILFLSMVPSSTPCRIPNNMPDATALLSSQNISCASRHPGVRAPLTASSFTMVRATCRAIVSGSRAALREFFVLALELLDHLFDRLRLSRVRGRGVGTIGTHPIRTNNQDLPHM